MQSALHAVPLDLLICVCSLSNSHSSGLSLSAHTARLATDAFHFNDFSFGRIIYSCSLTIKLSKTSGTSTLSNPFSAVRPQVRTPSHSAHGPWLNRHAGSSHWDSNKVPDMSCRRNWESSAAWRQVHAWRSYWGRSLGKPCLSSYFKDNLYHHSFPKPVCISLVVPPVAQQQDLLGKYLQHQFSREGKSGYIVWTKTGN